MPPSGYSKDQSGYIHGFLESVSESLEKEGLEKGLSPVEAMNAECSNIQLIANESYDLAEKSVLFLTEAFYRQILSKEPSDYLAYRKAVQLALSQIDDVVLSIHVPEI